MNADGSTEWGPTLLAAAYTAINIIDDYVFQQFAESSWIISNYENNTSSTPFFHHKTTVGQFQKYQNYFIVGYSPFYTIFEIE